MDKEELKRIRELAESLRRAERYAATVMLTSDIDELIDIGDGKEIVAQRLIAEGWIIPDPLMSKEVQ